MPIRRYEGKTSISHNFFNFLMTNNNTQSVIEFSVITMTTNPSALSNFLELNNGIDLHSLMAILTWIGIYLLY